MSRVPSVATDVQNSEVGEIFAEIENAFGMVPNLFRTYAHHPPLLQANWHKVKAMMMDGNLSRKLKETIAVLVSRDNGCDYCVAAHEAALRSIGASREEIAKLTEDLEKSDFTEKEKALISFACKANARPLKITDDEFALVRDAGASDGEIVEALGVMEIFTGFNKFLDSLQVEIDF